MLVINVGMLVLVHQYGADPYWFEVVGISPESVVCTNGHGDEFVVFRDDVVRTSDDDSVLKE